MPTCWRLTSMLRPRSLRSDSGRVPFGETDALVAGDRQAYTYLPQSVDRFVTPAELARLMETAGLREVTWRRLGLGTIALHWGVV
ncbi:MAG: hypothetical protein DMD92_15625 [Candidatus Rokuibacteriota bacterium]|nr:MAG: hypothetical protein DMD92_15625 [Candidatus Rokubacteria bacterium]